MFHFVHLYVLAQGMYIFCRAVVYICHGIGEYTGRYEQLAQVLSSNGILAVGHDHGEFD